MDLTGIAGWIVGGLAISGALAAAWVKVRSSIDNQTAEIWKNEAEAQKARADRLEFAIRELTERVSSLESENRQLRELVSGTAAIADLRLLVVEQHAELKALLLTA